MASAPLGFAFASYFSTSPELSHVQKIRWALRRANDRMVVFGDESELRDSDRMPPVMPGVVTS